MQRISSGLGNLAVFFVLVSVFVVAGVLAEIQATAAVQATAAEVARVGRQIENFTLRDFRGKEHSLAELKGQKLVVVAFLGTECPLVKFYAPRLAELAEQFAPQGVAFVGINSNRQDTVTEIGAFAQRNHISFPILKDPDNRVADQFAAVRTPEVFVLDAQQTDGKRVVRYWGRIDDQYGIGYQKKEAERRDLATALDELLAGSQVSQPAQEAPGCLIGRTQKVTPHGDVTYSKQIARVLQNRCVECHRAGEIAPFPLTSYEEVVGWADMICEVVDQGRMPPWFANPEHGKFENDCRLSDDEKELIHAWTANGCPQGDDADLPAPREYATGWRIAEPDQVVYMSDEPFDVPAEGVVDYQHFTADLGLTEEKWLQGAEARPGNPGVVHHIVCWITPPGKNSMQISFGDRLVAVFAPGTPPWFFPRGTAIHVPAGSKINFQMHYTPNGTAQQDRSYIGLVYADPKTVQHRARSMMAPNLSFTIPPGDDNYLVTSRFRVKRDLLLLNLFPHMHLRGKDFRFEIEYPDGQREVLLDVPRYDFNWQLRYDLVEPKLLPKGSKIHCTAHFDNSKENPFNPDPTKEVRFGEQTWQEMMVGFFTTAFVEEETPAATAGKAHDDEDDKADAKDEQARAADDAAATAGR